jgi:hypothetical protein
MSYPLASNAQGPLSSLDFALHSIPEDSRTACIEKDWNAYS